ncbi:MAG: OmpA family protein [Pseudomonadales bacterium]
MKNLRTITRGASVAALSLAIAGCISTPEKENWDTKRVLCVAAGSLAGAAIASQANDSSDGAAQGIGALIGAGVGAVACAPGAVLDGDRDGVRDENDKCPYTLPGTTVNAQGCSSDADGDGVADSIDQCPDTPEGVEVDETGCEIVNDQDGDGVPDNADQCPDTDLGTEVNALGCEDDQAIALEGVFFEYKSFNLTADSKALLDDVAEKLINAEAQVLLAGHTDNVGSKGYNLDLSSKRAATVKDYLISQGVDTANIRSQGFGESQPVASNTTEQGRSENRRVEIQVEE